MSICYTLRIEKNFNGGRGGRGRLESHKGNNRHSTVNCVDSIFWNSVF